MAEIAAIEKWARKRRADITLADGSAFSLSLDLIAERGLAVGEELTRQRQRALEAEDQRRGAIEAALRLLAVHPRSEKDLRQRLRRRGWQPAAVDAAVGRMRELRYLDDAAFARFWVDARQAATPRSRRFLQFELGRQGVDREIVEDVTEDLSDVDAAYEAAQRRLRGLRGLDRDAFQRRLGSFLSGRGFGYGVARQVLDRCWQEITQASSGTGEESP